MWHVWCMSSRRSYDWLGGQDYTGNANTKMHANQEAQKVHNSSSSSSIERAWLCSAIEMVYCCINTQLCSMCPLCPCVQCLQLLIAVCTSNTIAPLSYECILFALPLPQSIYISCTCRHTQQHTVYLPYRVWWTEPKNSYTSKIKLHPENAHLRIFINI